MIGTDAVFGKIWTFRDSEQYQRRTEVVFATGSIVGAQTYRLLTNLMAPKKPGELTYDEATEKLWVHFQPKSIKIAKQFRWPSTFRSYEGSRPCANLEDSWMKHCWTIQIRLWHDIVERKHSVNTLIQSGSITLMKALEIALAIEAAEKDWFKPTLVNYHMQVNFLLP